MENTQEFNNRMKHNKIEFISYNLPIIIFEWIYFKNGKKGFGYISPSANKILGLDILLTDDYLKYIDPSQHLAIEEEHNRCITTKSSFDLDLCLTIPNKEIKWIHVNASFTYQDINGDLYYTGYICDITQKRNARDRNDVENLFYEHTINEMPLAVFVINMKKEIIYKNRLCEDLIELRKNNRIKDTDITDKKSNEIHFSHDDINHIFEFKKQKISEEVLVDHNGSLIYYLNWLIPVLNESNEIIQLVGYSLNITNRKLIENKLISNEVKHREIIDKMNLGLIEINFNGDITFANSTFLKMSNLGYNELERFDIDNIIDSIEQDGAPSNRMNTWKTQKAKEISFVLNGNTVWWLLNITTQYDDDGNISVYIIVCLDISEQKKLEEELLLSKDSAEKNSKIKDIFIANISHEIRTPLNALIGLSNLFSKTNLDETQEKYAKLLKTSADNLLSIVNDVLDFSKINAGKLQIEEIPFSLNEVIKNNIKLFSNKADEKGIYLKLDIQSEERQIYMGDPYKFSQILSNLISNAIKFTETGGVSVVCKKMSEDEYQTIFQITISDTGIGIDEGFIDKIFEKFTQENESTTRIYGGTGLGMSITKELLQLLNGQIKVRSRKYLGSEFIMDIPFKKMNGQRKIDKLHTVEFPLTLKGKKILIVDDNDMNRLVASLILSEHGAEMIEAENGFDAINMIKNHPIDVILMDIQMPVMNGYETTRKIRTLGFNEPIIALTAYAVKDERDRCIESGMNDFITKPFEERHLISIINKVICQHSNIDTEKGILSHQSKADPELDLTELKIICNNDMKQFSRMMKLFIRQSEKQMEEMYSAYHDGDDQKIRDIAHQMKPSTQLLGLRTIQKEIEFLEHKHSNIGKNSLTELAIHKIQEVISKVWSTIHAMNHDPDTQKRID
jgi:PAS domain S-box-containing protein